MKGEKVLIDTSVWIDYFKSTNNNIAEQVDEILNNAEVYVPKSVIAELIQGAKSEKEISVIEEFVNAFHIIDQSDDTWSKAGKLSLYNEKKRYHSKPHGLLFGCNCTRKQLQNPYP